MDRPEQNGTPPAESGLTPRQARLLAALVVGGDMQAACRAAGVGRTTAYAWLRLPEFKDALQRQREAAFAEALACVKGHVNKAVAGLARLLSVKDARLRRLACNDVIGHAFRIREIESIEQRLDRIERALEAQGGRP